MMKQSIRESPVTMSALSIGMLFAARMISWLFFFMLLSPRTARVPITVAATLDIMAIEKVFPTACISILLLKSSSYH